MRYYKYETRNAQGRRCCAGDRPDHPRCGNCSPVAPSQPDSSEARTSEAWREHFAGLLGVGSIVIETPDAYRTAKEAAPRRPDPTDDPTYAPYGNPPNGWSLALNAQKGAK